MSRFDDITFNSTIEAISAATSRALALEIEDTVETYSLTWARLTQPGNPTAVMDCLECLP